MAAADAATIAAGVPEAELVERAGGAVARSARALLGGTYGRRVVVVAGKGNNGADGLVAARLLDGWGARVDVLRLVEGIEPDRLARSLGRADLAIDAMFGTGFRGPLAGEASSVATALDRALLPVLAVDIPSGVDGATGAVPGPAVAATATVCLAALKPGLLFHPGAAYAGDVEVVDIGVRPLDPSIWVPDEEEVAAWLPPRPFESHKWSVGAVYVVGGSEGMTGAALLSARAALRTGAGLVVAGLPGKAVARVSGGEVITRSLPATAGGALDDSGSKEVLDGLERFGALVVGPGLGRRKPTVAAVRRLVSEAPVPLVLDADGLNALAGDLDPLLTRSGPAVLTPHAGEYERLAGEAVGDDRLGAARRLARRTRGVVVLKGSRTVVAAPNGQTAINLTGGPWLATAGTGDVLSGMVGALLARGMAPFEAAIAAVYLHGRAADAAGHAGLLAGDLIDALPRVLASIGTGPGVVQSADPLVGRLEREE
ncbi:MAG: NAD(P)H-hydrate dehydratase [Actinomycetota bacterium]|nr:NAD(P)H-hydrate dehydratase [Actinomycetota bacterium]